MLTSSLGWNPMWHTMLINECLVDVSLTLKSSKDKDLEIKTQCQGGTHKKGL